MAATPAKVMVRQADGSLVEQDAPTASVLDQPQGELGAGGPGAASPPATPAGAKALGATPDEAKMVGSSAQKSNALTQTVAGAADLGQVQRQVGGTQPLAPGAADTAAQAKELAGGLGTLGSYGTRIQGLIKTRLEAVGQKSAAPTVADDQVAQLLAGQPPEKVTAAKAALVAYAASGSEADLTKLRDLFGGDKLAAGGLQRLYTGAPDALATLGKGAQGDVTVGQLDLAGGGIDPAVIAKDLGVSVETLNAMSPAAFQQAVQDTTNRSTSSVDALKAEYKSASPQRQSQILLELRAADASGLSAAEAAAEHIADSMSAAQTVRFAGADYNIQDLLKSDKVSAVIKAAADPNNPAALEQLRQSEPELAAWIVKNQASLATFAAKGADQSATLELTQTRLKDLNKDLTPELQSALGAAGVKQLTGTATAAQVDAYKAALEGNSLYKALQADKSGALKAALQSSADPAALATKLKDLAPEVIQQLVATSSALKASGVAGKLGFDISSGLLDPAQVGEASLGLYLYGRLPVAVQAMIGDGPLKGMDGLRFAGAHADFLARSDVQGLISDGTLVTAGALSQVAAHPAVLTELASVAHVRTDADALLTDTPDPAKIETLLFGSPLDAGHIEGMWAQADTPAAKQAMLQAYDANHDGEISAADFTPAAMRDRLRDVRNQLPGIQGILGGDGKFVDPFAQSRQALAANPDLPKLSAAADKSARTQAESVATVKRLQGEIAAMADAEKIKDAAGSVPGVAPPKAKPPAADSATQRAIETMLGGKVGGSVLGQLVGKDRKDFAENNGLERASAAAPSAVLRRLRGK
jgi:hypothetical protein